MNAVTTLIYGLAPGCHFVPARSNLRNCQVDPPSAHRHPAPLSGAAFISHLGRMPSLRRARSGRGQNLQKSTQVEASGEANSSNDSVSLPMFIIQHAYHSGCLRIERPSLTYPAASPFKGYFALQNPAIGMSTDFKQINPHFAF
jgi:hypothetical protein